MTVEELEKRVAELERRVSDLENGTSVKFVPQMPYAPFPGTTGWARCSKCGIQLATGMGCACAVAGCPTAMGGGVSMITDVEYTVVP